MPRLIGSRLIGLILALCCCHTALLAQEAVPTPQTALQRLKDGNIRFAADKPAKKDISSKRRAELAEDQHPFAIVLACADSRVSPELIFDQGLGDLFVIRVAGNVTDPAILGSIEYAVEHLKAPLIVVLGHEKCGAVKAALGGELPKGNLGELIKRVHVGDKLPEDKSAALATGVRANVSYQARQLTTKSTVLKEFVETKRVRVVSGVYSLKSGAVRWLDSDEKKNAKPSK